MSQPHSEKYNIGKLESAYKVNYFQRFQKLKKNFYSEGNGVNIRRFNSMKTQIPLLDFKSQFYFNFDD